MAETPALAGVSELSDWLGEPITDGSAEAKRAAMCLRAASVLVRKESGRTWVGEDGKLVDPLPDDAVMVTLYCAGRIFENREGQTRGGVDEYQEGWKVDEAGAYLTASEKRQLTQFKPARLGLATIGTTRGNIGTAAGGRVPTGTPGVEIPWY